MFNPYLPATFKTAVRTGVIFSCLPRQWMELVRHDKCQANTKYRQRAGVLTERMVCGVSDLTDACLGDSGQYLGTEVCWGGSGQSC